MDGKSWIGVDLDGTLALYNGWVSIEHIGEPVPAMLQRVKDWLADGKDVRIFTARVACPDDQYQIVRATIDAWTLKHLGRSLPVTCFKDMQMVELWDDRCVQVFPNTGERADGGPPTFMQPMDYPTDPKRQDELENQFTHHAPTPEQVGRYMLQRRDFLKMAMLVCRRTPKCREQSLALTKLEEAMFWANAAIARNE